MAEAALLEAEIVESDLDHVVRLHDVSWEEYKTILRIRGEAGVPRIAYLEGELELMSPARNHERVKSMFGGLLRVWAMESGASLNAFGSWTLKRAQKKRGVEADECYVVGDDDGTRREPDLAIEVVYSSGGVDKLAIYGGLGVREVWFWKQRKLTIHVLRGRAYVQAARSTQLADLDLGLLTRFVERLDQTKALLEYRDALREASRG